MAGSDLIGHGLPSPAEQRAGAHHRAAHAPQSGKESWPRNWADFRLLWLCSDRNAWVNLHLLGQPNTLLAQVLSHKESCRSTTTRRHRPPNGVRGACETAVCLAAPGAAGATRCASHACGLGRINLNSIMLSRYSCGGHVLAHATGEHCSLGKYQQPSVRYVERIQS
jgi:hypothetical protein